MAQVEVATAEPATEGTTATTNLLRMPRSRMLQRNPVEVNNLNADLVGSFMIEKKHNFEHVGTNPHVRPHPNKAPRQYHTYVYLSPEDENKNMFEPYLGCVLFYR